MSWECLAPHFPLKHDGNKIRLMRWKIHSFTLWDWSRPKSRLHTLSHTQTTTDAQQKLSGQHRTLSQPNRWCDELRMAVVALGDKDVSQNHVYHQPRSLKIMRPCRHEHVMGMSGELSIAQLLDSEVGASQRWHRLFSHVACQKSTFSCAPFGGVEAVRDLDDSSESFTSKSPFGCVDVGKSWLLTYVRNLMTKSRRKSGETASTMFVFSQNHAKIHV